MVNKLDYQLLLGQVLVVDESNGLKWIYDISPEDFDLLDAKSKKDEYGNIILSYPEVAALKRWTIDIAMKKVEEYMKDINVPEVSQPKTSGKIGSLSDLNNSTDEQLEELLLLYGGYRAYLESNLAYLDSKRGLLESSFEEGLAKMMFTLQKDREKRVAKEMLRGEALVLNPQLKKARQQLIETEAIYARIRGLKEAYRAAFDTVSRVVTLRTANRNSA